MSKSLGNYVGVDEPASVMFGKLMSIADDLMWSYYELLTDITPGDLSELRRQVGDGAVHPRAAKVGLAKRIVSDFHSSEASDAAEAEFDRVHVRREVPSDLRTETITGPPERHLLRRVLVELGAATSMSDATRKMTQGGVRVGGEVVTDLGFTLASGSRSHLVQVGKRFSCQVHSEVVDAS